MASEVGGLPNGNYAAHNGYNYGYIDNTAAAPQPTASHPPPSSSTPSNAQTAQQSAQPQPEVNKDEVGWYFVETYYTTLSKNPEKLYLFYNKRSQFVSGDEAQKVTVCVGQRSINDKIKGLDFSECKVRVTNVDSQASDANIVIQVIGEISNKGEPHKKFAQTFVLATQHNGYFVLNDIFRYLIDEEDEPEQEAAVSAEETQQVTESGAQEPSPAETQPKTLASSGEAVEADAKQVDKELEDKAADRLQSSEEAAAAVTELVNGESAEDAKKAVEEVTATPADPEPESAEAPVAEPEQVANTGVDVQTEKPKDPEPTPAATPPKQAQAPSQPVPAPKPAAPAVPMSWAARAAAASASRAQAPAPTVPQQSAAKPATSKPAAPAPTQASTSATTTAAPTAPAAQRQEPASDSQDEWNTVGHNRQQSRQTNVQQQDQQQQNRGYIKNVSDNVDHNELENALKQFGEIAYLDIARQKNCAFVDFKTAEAYTKATKTPFELNGEQLQVEERRIRPGSTPYVPRGQFQGARGGRGGAGQGQQRGNFQNNTRGAPRGRGGFPQGNTPRGRGGATGGN